MAVRISRDPIAEQGGLNLYAMVANNPVGAWDLRGLKDGDSLWDITEGIKAVWEIIIYKVGGKKHYNETSQVSKDTTLTLSSGQASLIINSTDTKKIALQKQQTRLDNSKFVDKVLVKIATKTTEEAINAAPASKAKKIFEATEKVLTIIDPNKSTKDKVITGIKAVSTGVDASNIDVVNKTTKEILDKTVDATDKLIDNLNKKKKCTPCP